MTVTEAPEVQKTGLVPKVVMGPFRTNEVCAPGCRVKVFVSNVSGLFAAGVPSGPPIDQAPGPPDVMLQGAAHAGAVVVPVLVPAKTTWQVDCVQEIGLPPLFLMEIESAVGELPAEVPAFSDAPITTTLVLAVALLTRL